MRLRLTPAFTVCLAFASVLGGAASRNAAGGADFVRLTPDQVSWRDRMVMERSSRRSRAIHPATASTCSA